MDTLINHPKFLNDFSLLTYVFIHSCSITTSELIWLLHNFINTLINLRTPVYDF